LRKQTLTLGHGKALLSVEDPVQRQRLFEEVLEKKLSVRDTESRAQEIRDAGAPRAGEPGAAPPASDKKKALAHRMATLSDNLTMSLSTRVELKGSDRRGKIIVHYGSREDLERILAGMQNRDIWQQGKI
ncbi:MAG TPA: hypothetical protein VL588_08225, partial [Bdellovibrionota bacterium]|nr:hypothetical protein [Bdellovibrionota bacterium]